jgi:NagD protein
VLVSGRTIIPGADQFIQRLQASGAAFLVLTNNPLYTPGDLTHRFHLLGLDIPAERIFTSAMATARFLHSQKVKATAFVIGESGLTSPIHEAGYVITDVAPDYVVLGETHSYNLEQITTAHPPGGGRRALHRHQSRSFGPRRGRHRASLRRDGCAD